jgi:hypothetical protein
VPAPAYPGAAFTVSIIAWAAEHGKLPSEVFKQYIDSPRDFQMIFAYEAWKAQEHKKMMDKAKKGHR